MRRSHMVMSASSFGVDPPEEAAWIASSNYAVGSRTARVTETALPARCCGRSSRNATSTPDLLYLNWDSALLLRLSPLSSVFLTRERARLREFNAARKINIGR